MTNIYVGRRKKKRSRKGSKKATVSNVHNIVRKQLGKTKEVVKLVSFMKNRPIRSINATNPWTDTVIYSLTGGRMGAGTTLAQGSDTPNITSSSLFALRPAYGDNTQLAGDGGQVDSNANSTSDSLTTVGVHNLRGRSCFLKNWHCNIRINNVGNLEFNTPGGQTVAASNPQTPVAQGIRLLIVETRRPLGQARVPGDIADNLARQIFLQFHSGAATGTQVLPSDITADAITGFLNFQVIKKVHLDKFFWLGDGDLGTFQTQKILRLKIPINKKAHFNYQYNVGDTTVSPALIYSGPFIYMIALGSSDASQDLEVAPRMTISSILTLEDD